ncbi:uncharacterized protein LOC123257654 [Drosophila ananassae]|uniref:uncharacterized protein LOC123257654 n=1 Tax=Drosophila ananassae TaxID=7217 RepID=UPI000177EE45|nr:uncharacterized protein LOC123257654 [Drosophila ananassae]
MFFTKLESWFGLQEFGARKDQEKFAAVIAYADPKYLEHVHDHVNNPPETAPSSTLKEAILSKFTDSEMVRLGRLATGIQLGDSRLTCQLQQTKATCDESVIRRYWIKRFPPPVHAGIVGMIGSSPQTKLSQLAKAADAVMDFLNDDAADHVYAFSKNKQQQSHQEERVITLTKRLDDND